MSKIDKQKYWDKIAKKFRSETDGLGMEIDKGIFDTVVALNILGFNTYQSCEGHLGEHGCTYPWVYIEPENMPEYPERPDTNDYDELVAFNNSKEVRAYQKEATKIFSPIADSIMNMLELFYKDHLPKRERYRLTLEFYPSRIRLQPYFSPDEEEYRFPSKEIREEFLKETQLEMQKFTEFLKKKYFKEE